MLTFGSKTVCTKFTDKNIFFGWQVALHIAAKVGNVGCAKLLLEHKAVVDVSDDLGHTPLIKAAAAHSKCADDCRHVDFISLLLNNGAKTDMIDFSGQDALIYASGVGSVDAVRVLLEHGANPNALALHEAATFGHVECVKALLAAGAHPHMHNALGYQPLELATEMDHAGVVECLLQFEGPTAGDAGDSAVVMAVASNAVGCLSVLLWHGANPDMVDQAGVPMLHAAIELNHSQIVRMLLKYNATINRRMYPTYLHQDTGELHDLCTAVSVDYLTPLMLAVLRDRTSMLSALVAAGASLNGILRILGNPAARQRLPALMPALTADSELERWLIKCCSKPLTLQLQSALAIRIRFSPKNISRIYDLPLPRPLLDFVAFSSLDK